MDTDFRVGQWLVQPQLNLIQGPDGSASVEPKAMDVLVCLAKQAGEVVSKDRLMQTVWAETFVTDEVLTNSIWELRKAFGDDAKNPKVIQTVFKKGYRLIAPVSFDGKASESGSTLRPSQAEAPSRPPLDSLDKGDFRGVHGESGSLPASRSPCSSPAQLGFAHPVAFLRLHHYHPKSFH